MTVYEEAVELLEAGSRQQVITFLVGLTPQERKALGPKFRRWLTHGSTVRVPRDRESLAVVATADGVRQAKLFATHGWGLTDEFVEDAVRILAERAPGWLPDFVESLLGEQGSWNWRVARGIVRAGLVPTPEHPEYFRGTVRGVPDYNVKDRRLLIEQLNRDPGLVGDHLLSMLSTEATGRLLAFHDAYMERPHAHMPDVEAFPAGTWRVAIVTLVQENRLDRGRLLDAILAAPLRDWAAADLGWYVGLHDALEPTLQEVLARQATYTRLLTVEHGPSVKTAQRELARALGNAGFQPELVLDASKATLGRTDKATVAAQLRLLEKLAAVHTDLDIADAVKVASDHPRADIREQAAKLLGRLGEPEPVAEQVDPFSIPAAEPWPISQEVEPVATPDELGEVLLGLIEEIDPIEMERAIDGLLRFADERPQVSDLLWTRANQGEYYDDDPRIAPVVLARAWLAPRKRLREGEWPIVLGHTVFPAQPAAPESFVGALGRRLTGVAQAIRRGPHPSVSLPNKADGSLGADVLTKRLSALRRRHEPLELEVALAMLRVPPVDRAHVVLPSSLRRSRLIARVLASSSPHWERQVISHQRFNWEPERRIPIFRNSAGREGDALDGILARPRPERTIGVEGNYGEYDPRFEQTLALGAVLLPHDPDILAAHAHPYLHRDLRKDRAASVPVLDALARSRTRNGAPASSGLVLGLGAKDVRARTAAQDALLDRARHGALDGTELGRQGALLLQDDIVVGKRLSTGLGDVARASDAAVPPIVDALQLIADVLPSRRDAGPFLELAADLAARTGRKIQLPAEFRDLAAGRANSMVAKAARRLL